MKYETLTLLCHFMNHKSVTRVVLFKKTTKIFLWSFFQYLVYIDILIVICCGIGFKSPKYGVCYKNLHLHFPDASVYNGNRYVD